MTEEIGKQMYGWAADLFPICRSITGNGVRQTLTYIKNLLPNLKIYEVPSGTKAFDWEVPLEWNIRSAFIEDENGNKMVDFKNNNLHVVSYSEPIDKIIEFDELNSHLHSIPELPHAIPYIASYYKRTWGFCIADQQRKQLKQGKYHVFIDSDLKEGSLTCGELILKGRESKEILLSSYICHPSMGNNELSGPVVNVALAQFLSTLPNRRYTYRILFIPETIGAIVYLSQNLQVMKERTEAGFLLTCIGDSNNFSHIPTRLGHTLADRVVVKILEEYAPNYQTYSFLLRGSDQRQFCSAIVDLPVVSIMRSKPGTYLEYHTSLDNLEFIKAEELQKSYDLVKKCVELLEVNLKYKAVFPCEPKYDKRGLYPHVSEDKKARKTTYEQLLAFADGNLDLIDISHYIKKSTSECIESVKLLLKENLIRSPQ